jgi:two-component system, cell cycle response regulator
MSETAIRIGTLGLIEGDLRVLSSLARLTAHRPRRYEIGEVSAAAAPDIVLFDGDSPAIVGVWRTKYSPIPSIMVSTSSQPAEPRMTQLARPLIASKLLNALDTMPVTLTAARSVDRAGDPATAKSINPGQANPANASDISTANTPAALAERTRADEVFEKLRRMSQSHPGDIARSRALVIDDSPTVRKQLELALRAIKVEVDTVESGEEGLALLATKRYALVFLDVVLPGWDGYQICKTIKKDAAIRDTPIVMLTSKSSPFDRIRGSLAGCDTYLTKPIDTGVFQSVLKKYLPAISHSAEFKNSKVMPA